MISIQHPAGIVISGASFSGKTYLVKQLINKIHEGSFSPKIEKIIWCFGEANAKPRDITFRNIIFCNGIPDQFENHQNVPTLIILDDLMLESNKSALICELFVKGRHHNNFSVIVLTQNLFHKGSFSRTISLNASHLFIMKNVRDRQQFGFLARQLHPENPLSLMSVYKDATLQPHSYLFIDLVQSTPEIFRFRAKILDEISVCYFPPSVIREGNGIIAETLGEEQIFAVRIE